MVKDSQLSVQGDRMEGCTNRQTNTKIYWKPIVEPKYPSIQSTKNSGLACEIATAFKIRFAI